MEKNLSIKDYVLEHDLDILYIAESWLNKKGDEVTIGDMTPEGYSLKQTARNAKNRGGGSAVIHKKTQSTHCNLNGNNGDNYQFKCKKINMYNVGHALYWFVYVIL